MSQVKYPITKSKLCKYLLTKNGCKFGNKCIYSHSEEEINKAKKSFKTSICNSWPNGKCSIQNCLYSHEIIIDEPNKSILCQLISNNNFTNFLNPNNIMNTGTDFQDIILNDVFSNGNIIINNDTIYNKIGKRISSIYIKKCYNRFIKIYNDETLFFYGQSNELNKEEIKKLDCSLIVKYIKEDKIFYQIKQKVYDKCFIKDLKFLKNGNILALYHSHIDFIDNELNTIKKLPSENNQSFDSVFPIDNFIFVSTSNKIIIYNIDTLEKINTIDNKVIRSNTIIRINGDKIAFIDFIDFKEKFNNLLNIYSLEQNQIIYTIELKYKIETIYEIPKKNFFIGLIKNIVIFYSKKDFKVLGYCILTNPIKNIIIRKNKIYFFHLDCTMKIYQIIE